MGVVKIVKCRPDELVHGSPLLPQEKKVVVTEVYPGGPSMDDETESEFVKDTFLRANKIFLRKLCLKRSATSKKKGRGHKSTSSPEK